MTIGTSAFAQEVAVGTTPPDAAGTYKPFVVGGYMAMGMALTVGDIGGDAGNVDQKPRFAGGGGAYFDYYLMNIFALEGGIGFIGKGFRIKEDDDNKSWSRFIDMEIPLGVKLNIKNFRASFAVVMYFVLSGKTKTVLAGHEDSDSYSGDDWDNTRRFNLGPKIALGYGIPVGPVVIVPGLFWSMDLINGFKDEAADAGCKARGMNLMFTAAVEFGFGSK
jgi:hypothetical protein